MKECHVMGEGLDRRYSVVPVQRKISVNGYSLKHTKFHSHCSQCKRI